MPLLCQKAFSVEIHDYETLLKLSKNKVRLSKPLSKKDAVKYRKRFRALFLNSIIGSLTMCLPHQGEPGYGLLINGQRQAGLTRTLLRALTHPKGN